YVSPSPLFSYVSATSSLLSDHSPLSFLSFAATLLPLHSFPTRRSSDLGIKYSIATIPPLLMGSVRFLVAGGILYAVAARTTDAGSDRLGPRQWLAAFVIGAALLVGGNGGVILAEQYVPTGVVAVLVAA